MNGRRNLGSVRKWIPTLAHAVPGFFERLPNKRAEVPWFGGTSTDKPLLDVLEKARNCWSTHRNLLKASIPCLNRPMLLCVLSSSRALPKFSQVSVFSGFNQPKDISMFEKYEALCGITEEELHTQFAEPIQEMAESEGCTEEEVRQRLKRHYDGYHFSKAMTDIYNPFSVLNAFDSKEIRDYWFFQRNAHLSDSPDESFPRGN